MTEQWIALCAELLGLAPTPADLQAGRVRVRWLSEQFQGHLPDHAPDELVQQHARAYILWLIGGVLLPDKSQNLLKLMYLPLLRDIDEIGQYNWGSAALACLYRMLCRAAQVGAKEIGGPLVLLQVSKNFITCQFMLYDIYQYCNWVQTIADLGVGEIHSHCPV